MTVGFFLPIIIPVSSSSRLTVLLPQAIFLILAVAGVFFIAPTKLRARIVSDVKL